MTRLLITTLIIAMACVSCAKMGRPDGGWYDETPPHVIGATPADRATGVKTKRVRILFDEYIKLDNATEKVVVSPPQLEQPEIKTMGRSIEVTLQDTLKHDVTYTIDFSDAISDNNEGNPLGNYTYSFSTGNSIDTLQVSGYVLQAEDLEPVKGTLVGLYDYADDSTFVSAPMLRVARTDSRGFFSIKGVSPGDYRINALNDMDGDLCFSQKGERIAFSDRKVTPTCAPAFRQDTLWLDSLRIKSIERVPYTRFMPDDIVLLAFCETVTDRHFLKAERKTPEAFSLFFSYGHTQLPQIKALDFDDSRGYVIEHTATNDTITYWLRDTALVNRDTLSIEMTYMGTDTLGCLISMTDTLQLLAKTSYEQRQKDKAKEEENWLKIQEKRKKKGQPYDSIMPQRLVKPRIYVENTLDPDRSIVFEFERPLAKIDSTKIHLYAKIDTLWCETPIAFSPTGKDAPDSTARPRAASPRLFELIAEWQPGTEYSLELDSMAFEDIYGLVSPKRKHGFKVKALEDYATVIFTLDNTQGQQMVVELLNAQDATVKRATVEDGTAQLFFIKPGTYYARLFVDDNANGTWDTGEYATGRQPETVYYYPREIECVAKRDATLHWDLNGTPLQRQKPDAVKKQKADSVRKTRMRNAERARKLGIAYGE